MRMWMVNPKILCRQHLLGEHRELHTLVGCINKKKSLEGYFKNNLIEPKSISKRHIDLVEEMSNRGYLHKSELPYFEIKDNNIEIDKKYSLKELLFRCLRCSQNFKNLKEEDYDKRN